MSILISTLLNIRDTTLYNGTPGFPPSCHTKAFFTCIVTRIDGGVFNLVFSFREDEATPWAVGRFYQDVNQMWECRHVPRFTWPYMSRWPKFNWPYSRNTIAYIPDVYSSSAKSVGVPQKVISDNIGEFKLFRFREALYLYGNTNGKAPNLRTAYEGKGWEKERKDAFLSGGLKNYLIPFHSENTLAPIDSTSPGTWLSYTDLMGTQKNFLFYERNNALRAVVQIHPHLIYSTDPSTGHMTRYSSSTSPVPNLGFPPHFVLSLSSGPVPLPSNSDLSLVGAHVSVGGWGSGTIRQTFFYMFSSSTGSITCVTPIINFGLDPLLEYNTHMEYRPPFLYLSMGVNNCYSVLVKIRLSAVVNECVGVGEERADLLEVDYEHQTFTPTSCKFCNPSSL